MFIRVILLPESSIYFCLYRNVTVTETLPRVKKVQLDVEDEKKESRQGKKEECVDRVYELDVKDKL